MGKNNLKSVADATFAKEVIDCDKAVLVEFTAEHCVPCRGMKETLDRLAPMYSDHVKICTADIFACNAHARQYGVQSLPTIIMFKGGVAKGCLTGEQTPKKMRKFIEETAR